jgi:hypothetical protein
MKVRTPACSARRYLETTLNPRLRARGDSGGSSSGNSGE